MLLPRVWLHDHCDPGVETPELVERLDLTGTAVERVIRHGVGSPERFVVGRVLSAEQHPDADRLRVCVVDVGDGEPAQIVCGAPNVAAGQTVAVARPGAVMPDSTKLGKAKLRGVESDGMILAEDELAIGTAHDGIIVLPDGPEPGTPLASVLPIATDVLELEITPNRPDCLGVYGVAREVHAAFAAPLAEPPWADDPGAPGGVGAADLPIEVVVEDPDLCPRFTARVFEGVTIGPSPAWLKARLTAAGQRPINNVVDITNFVMLLTGQPLHAFDLDRVAGGRLVVRRAKPAETLQTLDGVERTLDEEMMVILDDDGPTSLAGVMGGMRSEVEDGTTRVLMEAATWNGPNIHRTSQRLGLRSEASARFEKGISPESGMEAQAVAARLMLEMTGATLRPGTVDVGGAPPTPEPIRLRDSKLARLLGKAIPRDRSAGILRALGFEVIDAGDGLDARPPHFRRSDVTREADLIEEVARIHGLDKLPITLPARRRAIGRLSAPQRVRRRVEDALRDRGLSEVVAYSFTAPQTLEKLRLGDVPLLRIANPMSEDQSVMRPLLLPGLLDAARHNASRGRPQLGLFESAHVYRLSAPLDDAPDGSPRGATPAHERHHLGAVLTEAAPGTWRSERRPADFYAAKALVEAVLASVGIDFEVEPGERPFLHPGRTATVVAGDERKLGWIGELHPSVVRAWDLGDGTAAAFELDADLIAELAPGPQPYRDVTSFPAVIQDIAVLVDEEVPAGDVEEAVRRAGAPLLDRAELFDVYRGDQIGEGRKSLALRLEFRAPDRTLTDEDVAGARVAIEAELAKLGGALRA